MGIVAQAPRGGLREVLAGRSHPMLLSGAEIERFEDAHRGLFDIFDAHYTKGAHDLRRVTVGEARDLVALGLVGAGMLDAEADAFVASLSAGDNLRVRSIALALIGAAFAPDWIDADDGDASEDGEKKNDSPAAPGTSDAS